MSAPRPELSSAAKAFLKRQAHALKPVVQVGAQGVDEGLVAAVDRALLDHELIKVKVGQSYEGERKALAERLAAETRSAVCQVMGRVITLYRPHTKAQRKPTSLDVPA